MSTRGLGQSARGTIMMEMVIVLPLLLLLFFMVLQFGQLWLVKHILAYAAYSSARAALVYNPKDYMVVLSSKSEDKLSPKYDFRFMSASGPLHRNACIVLSWLEAKAGLDDFQWLPKSSQDSTIYQRVRISGTEGPLLGDDTSLREKANGSPFVSVTVHYYFPLIIPMASDVLKYALAGGKSDEPYPPDYASVVGGIAAFEDNQKGVVHVPEGKIYRDKQGFSLIHLQASCLMPKPYSTETFAMIPSSEREFLGLEKGR